MGVKLLISRKFDGNMALHTGDDSSVVIENRRRFLFKHSLALENLVCMNQIHSSTVAVVGDEAAGRGALVHTDAIDACDALVTSARGLALAVMTADCVPVLLWDEHVGVIGAAHAGWKGTAADIASKTVVKMVGLGAKPQNIKAFIGACIGKCCFEVGADTAEACGCAGASKVDLKLLNQNQLLALGIQPQNIEISDDCTVCNNENYFSYRKENGCAGRFMSVISLL